MGHTLFAITGHITSQLAQLLGRDIAHLYLEARQEAIPATVHLLSLVDRDQHRLRLVLKAQEDQIAFSLHPLPQALRPQPPPLRWLRRLWGHLRLSA